MTDERGRLSGRPSDCDDDEIFANGEQAVRDLLDELEWIYNEDNGSRTEWTS